jgi:hypothetical protein
MATSLDDLIRRADLDELIRHVDATCDARDWDHLVRIRNEARAAVSTGRQLWPIATLANYRLALWAPADIAVRALDDTARTFMPGPVSEIISVHHTWADLEPHLAPGHDRSLIAYERSLRGCFVEPSEPALLDIPIAVQMWEPTYAVAMYTDDGPDDPFPEPVNLSDYLDAEPADVADDPESVHAFRRLVEPWTAQSNGTAHAVVVEGGIGGALHALGLSQARTAALTAGEALVWLTWAGASGGAHGKRRGTATGRSEAWWFLATFSGLADHWPCEPDELGDVLESLEYTVFENEKAPTRGWGLHLLIEDPDEGLSIALSASDTD